MITRDDHQTRGYSRTGLLILTVALLGSGSMLDYYMRLFVPRVLQTHAANNLAGGYDFGRDFYPVWLTSHDCIPAACDPYSPEMTRKIQRGLFGRTMDSQIPSDQSTDYRTFVYPAFTDLLFWPAAQFPFTTVRVAVAVLLVGLTIASVVFWMQAISLWTAASTLTAIVLLVLCSYPVLEGLHAEQLGLVVGFLLAASLLALRCGRNLLAGTIMALTTIKPQMTILVMVYLLIWSWHNWRERGRFCIGLFSTIVALSVAAMLVWPRWIQSWIRVLLGYHHYANPPLAAEIFHFGSNLGGTAFLGIIAVLLTLFLSWKKRSIATNSIEFWSAVGFLLCLTAVTLLPSQGFHDHVVLLPAIFLVGYRWKELSSNWTYKVLVAVGAAALLWPFLAAFGLICLRPLLTNQVFYSKAVFVLPLRTAAVLPFVLLGVLALSLRSTQRVSA